MTEITLDDDIQTAIDAETPGGTVSFTPGEHVTQHEIRYTDGITIEGAGYDRTTIRAADGMNDNVFRDKTGDEANVTFRDFRIDGNKANDGTGNGIRARPAGNAGDGFALKRLVLDNCDGESIHLGGDSVLMDQILVRNGGWNAIVAGLNNSTVRQFTIKKCRGFGFSIGHAADCLFKGIWVHNTSKVAINLEDANRYTLDGFAVGGSSPGDWKAVRVTGGKGHVVRNGYIDLTQESYDWGKPATGGVLSAVGTDPADDQTIENVHIEGDPNVENQTGVVIRANRRHHNNGALVQAIRGSDLEEMVSLSSSGEPIDNPTIRNLDGERIDTWLDDDRNATNVTFDRTPGDYTGPTPGNGPEPGPWLLSSMDSLPMPAGDDTGSSGGGGTNEEQNHPPGYWEGWIAALDALDAEITDLRNRDPQTNIHE